MLCYLDPCHFRHALVLGDLATSQQLKFSDDATQDPAEKSRKGFYQSNSLFPQEWTMFQIRG